MINSCKWKDSTSVLLTMHNLQLFFIQIDLLHGWIPKFHVKFIRKINTNPSFPRQKSAGLPLKNEGIRNKGEAADNPAVMHSIREEWSHIERNHVVQTSRACFGRAQICPRSKNKIRATWGYPLTAYLAEGQYFYPLLEYLKNIPHPIIAYGVEMSTGGMNYINDMVKSVPGAWSKFDKTIPAWLIRDAFKLVLEAFDLTKVQDSEGHIWPVRPERSKRRWNKIVQYFTDTPIRLSNGDRFIKHAGVPSGSCFTNVIDSIINAIVMHYLTYELTDSMPYYDIYLGDDSCVGLTKPISLTEFSSLAKEHFGMNFNTEKSYIKPRTLQPMTSFSIVSKEELFFGQYCARRFGRDHD